MIRLDYKYDPCLAGRGSANYVEFAVNTNVVNTNVGNLRVLHNSLYVRSREAASVHLIKRMRGKT
jgi:hypothetical protein